MIAAMQLPEFLQQALQQELSSEPMAALRKGAEQLMAHYKDGRSSGSLFQNNAQLLAYLAIRMPATYAAIYRALQQCSGCEPKTLLDLGAGPGTASWAAAEIFPMIEQFFLVEESQKMAELGERLALASGTKALREANWLRQTVQQELPSADLALLCYLIGELPGNQPEQLLERLWERAQIVVIVEPGTPAGYQRILRARSWALAKGACLMAPCPHSQACPMQSPDWCHFPARVERTRLHKELKGGTLGYEDEKFSYLIYSKISITPAKSRIVRQPQKGSGFVRLSLCKEGKLVEELVSRKKENYRKARDAEWGDPWM